MTDKERKRWVKNAREKISFLEQRVAALEKELEDERAKHRE